MYCRDRTNKMVNWASDRAMREYHREIGFVMHAIHNNLDYPCGDYSAARRMLRQRGRSCRAGTIPVVLR